MTQHKPVAVFGIGNPTFLGNPHGLLALAGLAGLHAAGKVDLAGFVANGSARHECAALARFTMQRHGVSVPIGIGLDGDHARVPMSEPALFMADPGTTSYIQLSTKVLAGREPRSVRAVFTSGMAEAAWLTEQPALWEKFERIVVTAGVVANDGRWEPKRTWDAADDRATTEPRYARAADRFFRHVQTTAIPVTVLDRRVATWAGLPGTVCTEPRRSFDDWVATIGSTMRNSIRTTGETPSNDGRLALEAVLAVALLLEDDGDALGAEFETVPGSPNVRVLRAAPTRDRARAVAAQRDLIEVGLSGLPSPDQR